jgi:hypothetical protein
MAGAALTVAALAILLLVPAAAEAVTGGERIAVNTTTAGYQLAPPIAADGSGAFAVAWESSEQDGSGGGIYARRFNASGEPLSGEVAVNTTTAGNQTHPAIAADGSGGFTVAWESNEQDGSGWGVYARRFDTAGEPLTGEIPVNTTTAGNQESPAIAPDGSGGFTVAWESYEPESSGGVVYVRRFDASGNPLSGEIPVNAAATTGQHAAQIAAEDNGDFTVAWGTSGGEGVQARRFEAAGEPLGGAVRLDPNFYSARTPQIALDGSGGFDVAWEGSEEPGPREIFARRFGATGNPLSVAVRVDPAGAGPEQGPEGPAIAANGGGGGFTVAWVRVEGGDEDVFARQFVGRPETRIESGPSGPTNDATPTFSFSSDEYGSSFECRLDGGGFTPCTSPFTTAPLADGPHSFEVQATNPEGETELSPATRSFTLDTVAPETSLDSGPTSPTNDTTPTFAFSSSDPSATLECKLDIAAYAPCDSPLTVGPLADGLHSFYVRARDAAGNVDPSPAGGSFTVDTTAPEISIESGPEEGASTNEAAPTFAFASNEQGTSFECQLDDGPAAPCDPPFASPPLPDGPHRFLVWGTDEAGNRGVAPRNFTIDTLAPDTEIDSGPPAFTNQRTPAFSFGSEEAGASFECRLDDDGFSPCTSPFSAPPLPDGPHRFEVRAVDEAANADPTPAARSFTVDTTPPDTRIDSAPADPTKDNAPSFSFSADETGASFECQLDGGPFAPCSSPFTSPALPDGPHTFAVRAIDQASNVDPSPASASFTVDTVPPLVKLSARKRQRAGKPIVVKVSCSEDCSVRAWGSIAVWRGGDRGSAAHRSARRRKLRFGLTKVSMQLGAGRSASLKLRPRGWGPTGRLRRLVGRGMRARAAIGLAFSDAAGSPKTVWLRVGLRRARPGRRHSRAVAHRRHR